MIKAEERQSPAKAYQVVEDFMFAEMKGNLKPDAFKESKHYTSSCDTWNPIQ
ncbi:hypothetical protein [Streptomyces chiangmaiensis]|uniref:Uncharacterized protein n=1 Tax=Streptomyces chiangmaiensis TaxID=766497 RepID=A0ABU7FY67_9ACTN|nr:hypothetical protein [Streptomyces chiangmaiensis]MED7828820.1 hypothetical protein [Streptomyces chiangmaiensis]